MLQSKAEGKIYKLIEAYIFIMADFLAPINKAFVKAKALYNVFFRIYGKFVIHKHSPFHVYYKIGKKIKI